MYQVGMKPMKIKLPKCWEERKERKERKNRYAELNRGRWTRFAYIKVKLQWDKNSGKANCGINVEKYVLKIKN